MSNRFSKYAHRVKRALAGDPAVASPGYQWCLQQVKAHWDAAWEATHEGEGSRSQRLQAELIRRITLRAVRLDDDD